MARVIKYLQTNFTDKNWGQYLNTGESLYIYDIPPHILITGDGSNAELKWIQITKFGTGYNVYLVDVNNVTHDYIGTQYLDFASWLSLSYPIQWFVKVDFYDNNQYTALVIIHPVFINIVNTLYLYTYAESRNTVSKTLTSKGTVTGNFTNVISYRDLEVVFETTSPIDFNYVYIPVLQRYYFVTVKGIIREAVTLSLHEDVLMSWAGLIRTQTAYVDRQQNLGSNEIVDDLVSFDYGKSVVVTELTNIPNLFNVGTESDRRCIVLTAMVVPL